MIPTPSGQPTESSPVQETPALRFFRRGEQLQRLQQHVTANMTAEIEREYAAFKKLTVTDSASAMKVAGAAMMSVASGSERVSDVQLMLQLFFCRHVDNFQIFLEETIYSTQPGLLKRSEQVTVSQVLSHETMGTFIAELIESRIHKLAYKSIRDLASYIKEEIKFDLFSDRKTTDTVELAFDVRNLITHNYGIVNKIFLSKHPDMGLVLDQPFPVWPERIADEVKTLVAATGDIEKRARSKFKLYIPGA
jgi:hypothetical protein